MERDHMETMGGSSTSYFYLHLPVIHELGVMIPFTPFKSYFLTNANDTLSQITSNIWSIIRAFKIICCHMGVLIHFFLGV